MNPAARMDMLKRLLDDNPRDGLALYALALEHRAQGNFHEALTLLDRLLALEPEHVAGYDQKARIHAELGQTDDARKTLEAGIPKAIDAGLLHARDKMRELLEKLDDPPHRP